MIPIIAIYNIPKSIEVAYNIVHFTHVQGSKRHQMRQGAHRQHKGGTKHGLRFHIPTRITPNRRAARQSSRIIRQ